MLGSNVAATVNKLLETVYTVDQRVTRIEQDIRDIRNEIALLRAEHNDHRVRLAVLEESRNTVRQELRAVVAETVADLRIKFAEAQAAARAAPEEFLPPTPSSAEPDTKLSAPHLRKRTGSARSDS